MVIFKLSILKVPWYGVSASRGVSVYSPAEAGTNLYCLVLGEQRHMCVNNLPRVAPSGGTAGNRTRNLLITNPTPYRYATKPNEMASH